MPIERLPATAVALCLTIYWCSVIVLGVRLRRKIGKGPNSIPPDPVGLFMRAFWVPAILLQILHAWRISIHMIWPYTKGKLPMYVIPRWEYLTQQTGVQTAPPEWWLPAALVSGAVVIVCLSLTFICWRKMGKSWRIGIDRGETLEFISSGPYNVVRHPIYALRILLDLCAIVAVPTVFMAVVTGVDILMLAIEARREERYMESTHGEAYAAYKKRVGRFVPRTVVPQAPVG
jgi:protein-S-isoprenylcysteine O-methyltransferase Ste14